MKIAICDDEEKIRDMLADKVRKAYPGAELLFCRSGEELLAREDYPDILFLDIRMPGRSGMEIAGELRKKNKRVIIIFVTAVEECVFQAFDVGAFHYLVKPFTDEKFLSVLYGAVGQYKAQPEESSGIKDRYLVVKSGKSHIRVLMDEIIYAEVFNRKVMIHMMEQDIEYYGRLSGLERLAGEDFFRSHRAYLIHFKYVVKYDASTIYMEKGTALMAKQNYPEFVKRYMKYNQRKGSGRQLW